MSAQVFMPAVIGRALEQERPLSAVDPKVRLVAIGPDELDAVFPVAAPLLAESLVSGRLGVMGRLGAEDLYAFLASGEMQLFLLREGEDRVLGALVTEVICYPQKRVLSLAFLGGREMHRWVDRILDLERWARSIGCQQVEIPGRKGWGRVFAALGYEPITWTAAKEI